MSNIIINGAAENGNGAVELTVATDGSITATSGTDKNNIAPSTADLASKLADGTTTTASGGKLHAAAGGGPSVMHFKATYTSGQIFLADAPMPACKVTRIRYRWGSVPSGAQVVIDVAKYNGSSFPQDIQVETVGASGLSTATGLLTFAAGERLAVAIDEDASGNPANGSKLDIVVEISAP